MQIDYKKIEEFTIPQFLDLVQIRISIFVVEQACPYQEIDEIDTTAIHVRLMENHQILAYCRIYSQQDGIHIGRLLCTKRRKGYATSLLKDVIQYIQLHYPNQDIVLEAQTYARGLYEKVGFIQTSQPFLEDNIEHIQMKYQRNQ